MSNSIVEDEFQLATTGPTTLLGFPSTDVAEGHNDKHSEHNEQHSKKKKHVYRKEAQKSYRQRLKTKEAEIETAYVQSKQEKETLTTSIHFLQENQRALELLNVEAEHLLDHLLKAQKTLPADDPYQAADNMLELSYSGTVPNDDDVRRFMSLPPPAAAKLELDHVRRLASLMEEWSVCYSSRDKIESRLKPALQIRIKLTVLFPLLNPKGALRIYQERAAPLPGSAAGDAARKRLATVLKGLNLGLKQKEGVLVAFKEYQAHVGRLRAEMALAQLVLCTGISGIIEPIGELPGQTTARVEKTLSVGESASILDHMPMRMIQVYSNLSEGILAGFTTIQHANLLLGCMPHLVDYVAVAELILEEMESQRRTITDWP